MGSEFRISVHKNDHEIHLKLAGDFDGISAHELLDVLKLCGNRPSRVFVHTGSLRDIHPFGRKVFHSNLTMLKGRSMKLIFTGEKASQLAPESALLFDLTITIAPPVAVSGTRHVALSSTKVE
jgi:anti-anti-sigma regulatory factor